MKNAHSMPLDALQSEAVSRPRSNFERQFSDPDILQEFEHQLAQYTVQAKCGRNFVLTTKLLAWLNCVSSGGAITNLHRLLNAAYALTQTEPWVGLPEPIESIRESRKTCIVLCILLELHRAELFWDLHRTRLKKFLPIEPYVLKRILEDKKIKDAEALMKAFDNLQWKYCPPILEHGRSRDYTKRDIMPFIRKDRINSKSGMATLWMIELYEDSIDPNLAAQVPHSRIDDGDRLGIRYRFALKSYARGSKRYFDNEKRAFDGLRSHDGMVKCLFDYSQDEPREASNLMQLNSAAEDFDSLTTHNLLLEYGTMDLDVYFVKHLPPIFQKETISFWQSLIGSIQALEELHCFTSEDKQREYRGVHGDIRPDNILLVDGKLKLADPGFAKFMEGANQNDKTHVDGATWVYGAPERRPNLEGKVTQAIDIWSLGCVLSIASTWIVGGYPHCRDFNKVRENAVKQIKEKQPNNQLPNIAIGAFFHDGQEVLEAVTEWHQLLRGAARQYDTITRSVLDLVDQRMLVQDSMKRISAEELCAELKSLVRDAESTRNKDPSSGIIDSLLEMNREESSSTNTTEHALSIALHKSSGTADDRKAEKNKIMSQPLKPTAGRTAYSSSTSEVPRRPHIKTDFSSNHYSKHNLKNPQDGLASPFSPTSVPRDKAPHKPETVNDFLTSTSSKTEKIKDLINFVKSRDPHKNKELIGYFNNRDIRFLVDNGSTMVNHWERALKVMEALVRKAEKLDKDGMDLSFTNGPVEVRYEKHYSKFLKAMQHRNAKPNEHFQQDITSALGRIFARHTEKVENRRTKRDLTLIVFTDGIWDGMFDKSRLKEQISYFLKKVRPILEQQVRPFSIQFIQFGRDPDATYMLRSLDDELVWEMNIEDIIDVEHADGDINKMLLGSFVEKYDQIAHDDSILDSPTVDDNMQH